MKASSKKLFLIALLADLTSQELHCLPLDTVIDGVLKSRMRNLMKGSDLLVAKFDEMFEQEPETAGHFGTLADYMKQYIDDFVKKTIKEL